MKYMFLSLRPKQWIKNLFIFLPLIFGKKMFVFPSNLRTIAAFFVFSMVASAVYLINDIIDYEKDKLHPTKCQRPFASGKIGNVQMIVAACILSVLSFVSAFMLDGFFGWIVVSYFVFNLVYTKVLKEVVIIDIFSIAGFFLLRIIAGCIISSTAISHWIIFMTILLALFLGFNKRRGELQILGEKAKLHRIVLTKYSTYFIDQMIAVITSSVVIVYMLYTIDNRTLNEFGSNHLMYSIPFVYYGIFRYLYLVHKINKDGDPTTILFSDRNMRLNLALWIVVCILVIYFGF